MGFLPNLRTNSHVQLTFASFFKHKKSPNLEVREPRGSIGASQWITVYRHNILWYLLFLQYIAWQQMEFSLLLWMFSLGASFAVGLAWAEFRFDFHFVEAARGRLQKQTSDSYLTAGFRKKIMFGSLLTQIFKAILIEDFWRPGSLGLCFFFSPFWNSFWGEIIKPKTKIRKIESL